MFIYLWPIILVVFSNVIYQVCAKNITGAVSPFASLTVTYLISAICSLVMYFLTTSEQPNLMNELLKLNWATYVLGIVIIGLEVGFIYAYKVGWQVGSASIVQSSLAAVALVFVGKLLYNEIISWNKILGVAICLIGLIFINCK